MSRTILNMDNISKSFNGIQVLHDVGFELRAGEVHALMGGNGAGKSTLMKILTGVYELDAGAIRIDGREVEIRNTHDAKRHGVSMIFQEFSLIPTLTVAQNIFLNNEPRTKLGLIDGAACARKAKELLAELRVDLEPTDVVENLGVGYWQLTEIAKALSHDTKILIMDEPTSSLTKHETEFLFQLIDRLRKKGMAIIYISHRMDEIFRVCDRITILRDGRHSLTDECANVSMNDVIEHIVGGGVGEAFEWVERSYDRGEEPVLEVRGLAAGERVKRASFELYRGEIVGVAGLMGSGRTELARALFGIDPISSGEIVLRGVPRKFRSPAEAMAAGIALVPEDRRVQGLVLEHSVRDNIALTVLSKLKKGLFLDDGRGNRIAEDFVRKLSIKTDHIHKPSGLLSGGNQQKIVIAKWLAIGPDILILDEPTIGVDIGAKTEIVKIIREFADSGKSVLVISSELVELLAVSDRILVMQQGEIKSQLRRQEIETEEELQYAIQNI
ncbi:sugar ABC transporter ATP-binding protein [Paenibacillaceae bacterium WGS1546]|uniref:sugar ABC transporter ATP-binding protein n=1 Tax=Cohnella sp. WGS1546 TaxID=3366810 RepID=UPI00372D877B